MQSRSVLLKNMFDPEESVVDDGNFIVELANCMIIQRDRARLGQGTRGGRQEGM
jgi:hypothetical protein